MPKRARINAKILVDLTILFTKRRLGVVQPYATPRYSMFFETYLLKLFCIFASLRDTFVCMETRASGTHSHIPQLCFEICLETWVVTEFAGMRGFHDHHPTSQTPFKHIIIFNPCLVTNAIIEENRLTAVSWYYSCCLKRLWNPEINKRNCRPLNHCTNRGKEKEIYENIVKRKILSTKGSTGWNEGSKTDVFRRDIYPQINVTLCAVLGYYQEHRIPVNNLWVHLSTITYNLIW